jgi:hypothetical protein
MISEVTFIVCLVIATAFLVAAKFWQDNRRDRRLSRLLWRNRPGTAHRLASQGRVGAETGTTFWSRVKLPGRNREPWSAADEDHAWNVGVGHAYAREPFNPPRQLAFRDAYLDGYRSTSEDEDIPNNYPDE